MIIVVYYSNETPVVVLVRRHWFQRREIMLSSDLSCPINGHTRY